MLIRTKLNAPSLKSHMLFRKNIVKRLYRAKDYPFVLLSGPAGSGKTSLAHQWINNARLKAAWYSMDQEDNNQDLFYRYLLSSFIHADEQFKESFGPMLSSRQKLDGKIVIPQVIDALSGVNRKINLILDDFHHIENEEILHAVARLMRYIPAGLQLVILSRYRLPALINAVLLKQERLEITAADLKFAPTETVNFFKKAHLYHIPADQIIDLNRRMEGWAAGLQLITLAARSKGNGSDLPNILNHAHEQIARYLIHDILHRQPENIRNFIFATALLDRFNPDVCAKITGQKKTGRLLAHLENMNIFLIPLDTQRKWYRYHHMFSEVVRRQIAEDHPDLIFSTLSKAALWFAANNYMEDAMRSAFRSGDFNFCADLMENHISQYMEQFDPMAGLRWIERLPSGILNQRPLLRLHQCNFLMILLDQTKLKEILASIESPANRALERYSKEKRILCEDYIIYLKCMLKILHVRHSSDLFQLEALSKKISPQNSFFARAIEMIVINGFISKGNFSMAEASLARIAEQVTPTGLVIRKIHFEKPKALIARHRGRLHQSETIISRIIEEVNLHGYNNLPVAFLLHRQLGHIYYLQNRLDEARECADLAVRHCEFSGLIHEIMAGSELLMLLHLAAEQKEKAEECIEQLRVGTATLEAPKINASLDACAARVAIQQGNLAPAVLWSYRRKIQMNEPFSLVFAMECLTQARLYYAQEKYTKALSLLEKIRDRCRRRELLELILQIDILRSALFHVLNRYEKAISLLMEALAFAEAEGYIRPFVNDAEIIAPILIDISKNISQSSFITLHLEKIFSACDIPFYPSDLPHGSDTVVMEDLTEREIEILELMAQGAQNREIAEKANISINTVKTHVRSILAKLNVSNRTQAMIKAKRMPAFRKN